MNNLSNRVRAYAKANGIESVNFLSDVILQDDKVDGISAPYIAQWNLDIPQPSLNDLESYEDEANDLAMTKEALRNRKREYGSTESQIEFITENGIEAWQAKVAEIKAKYPKP